MVTVDRETTRLVELLIGAIAIGSFLIEVYVYPLYTSSAVSLLFTVVIPIVFATGVLVGVVYDGYTLVNATVGGVAGVTLLIGLWSLYGFYTADGGVFFGGLITIAVSFGLFVCVLVREIHFRRSGGGKNGLGNATENV